MQHMNLFLISICAFFHALQAQYVNIWNDNQSMDTNNGWIGYNNFNFTWSSDKCIIGPCGYITADYNGLSYIEKITNITSYSSIQFQVDITAYNQKQTDYCQIWFNFDNYTVYTKHSAWSYGKYRNVKVNFPQSINPNTIYIRLQVIGNHSTCFWDNAILKGMLVNISNITTDITYFYSSTSAWIIYICAMVPCVCCIVIVIIRLTCNKNYKIHNKSSLSHPNEESLQNAIMEIMPSLQLSEYHTHSHQSKNSHIQIKQLKNHDMHSTTHRLQLSQYHTHSDQLKNSHVQIKQLENHAIDMHSTTYTISDRFQYIVTSKKGNYIEMNESEFDDDEKQCLFSNVTTNPASETSSYECTKKKNCYESLVKQVNELKADTLFLVGKLDGMLDELEFEILKLKDESSLTDVNTYSTTVPESINFNTDSIADVDTNLDNVSMYVNISNSQKCFYGM